MIYLHISGIADVRLATIRQCFAFVRQPGVVPALVYEMAMTKRPPDVKNKLEFMPQRVEELLAVHARDIAVVTLKSTRGALVLHDLDGSVFEVQLPIVKSDVSYATCLHEIGHICGRRQRHRDVMVVEREAWAWAKRNAIVWTPQMERHARSALGWYAAPARRRFRQQYAADRDRSNAELRKNRAKTRVEFRKMMEN